MSRSEPSCANIVRSRRIAAPNGRRTRTVGAPGRVTLLSGPAGIRVALFDVIVPRSVFGQRYTGRRAFHRRWPDARQRRLASPRSRLIPGPTVHCGQLRAPYEAAPSDCKFVSYGLICGGGWRRMGRRGEIGYGKAAHRSICSRGHSWFAGRYGARRRLGRVGSRPTSCRRMRAVRLCPRHL
jgi:hypothetical protein